tara:strand:+ start:4277 stop:6652 length:2376 start_codon:yes stop_codon:yes gene_type:complete
VHAALKNRDVTLLAAILVASAGTLLARVPAGVEKFLEAHCLDCHDADANKGDLNLGLLKFDLRGNSEFATWKRVFERVEADEMPPRKKSRPTSSEKATFLETLKSRLVVADREEKSELGRVNVRRLTRREYENTIHDLLGVDMPLQERLPEDPATHGFETVAIGQQLSHHNLQRYLETADLVLHHAFERATVGERKVNLKFGPRLMARRRGGNFRGPQDLDDVVHFWPITLQFYGRMPMTTVRSAGWYRITLKDVRAVNPREDAVWGTLRSGACSSSAPILYPIGLVEATKEKRDLTYTAWIQSRHMLELKPNDASQRRARSGASGGNVGYRDDRSMFRERVSGIEVSGIEMERIYPNSSREELRENIFHGFKNEDGAGLKVHPRDRQVYRRLIRNFAGRAFRRPASDEQIDPYIDLAIASHDEEGQKPTDALRAAYRAILCSPRFLTFIEKPGRLDEHALASRLSYALWNSMPDAQLRKLADHGKLTKNLRPQLTRMLDDPKAERFIESFTDQWLNLKEIDFTTPDRRLYRTFDEIVKQSMLDETRAFVKSLIDENESVTHLVQSDFAMLNERLVRYYGLRDVNVKPGRGIQRVDLSGHPRAGLITQGSILKVTANGTTTSPVIRGVWVNERILGMEIPPPPADVPAIEPDIRGAVSIRDRLNKHRDNESCASCHRKIDPAGFALENLDPVGLVRARYGRNNGKRIDPSGVTPDGEKFDGLREWKSIYAKRPELLARSFARHLLTYATGATPRFSDNDTLDEIVEQSRKHEFGLRSILFAAFESDIFKSK